MRRLESNLHKNLKLLKHSATINYTFKINEKEDILVVMITSNEKVI